MLRHSRWLPAMLLALLLAPAAAAAVDDPAREKAAESVAAPSVPYDVAIRKEEAEMAAGETAAPGSGGVWGIADLAGVAALLAAIGMLLYATRWTRGLSSLRLPGKREMILLDRMATGRQSTLLLIRLRGKDYWVADHPAGMTLLAKIDEPEEPINSTAEKMK